MTPTSAAPAQMTSAARGEPLRPSGRDLLGSAFEQVNRPARSDPGPRTETAPAPVTA